PTLHHKRRQKQAAAATTNEEDEPPLQTAPPPPAQGPNSLDDLSVPPSIRGAHPAAANQGLFYAADGGREGQNPPLRTEAAPGAHAEEVTVWYDVSLPHDREQLKALQLNEGDSVNVKAVAPPLRIDGIVHRP